MLKRWRRKKKKKREEKEGSNSVEDRKPYLSLKSISSPSFDTFKFGGEFNDKVVGYFTEIDCVRVYRTSQGKLFKIGFKKEDYEELEPSESLDFEYGESISQVKIRYQARRYVYEIWFYTNRNRMIRVESEVYRDPDSLFSSTSEITDKIESIRIMCGLGYIRIIEFTTIHSGVRPIHMGGTGGTLSKEIWDMKDIKSIELHAGTYVDSVTINDKFIYGGVGGSFCGKIEFGEGEVVTEIHVQKGLYIDFIEFITNKEQVLRGGGSGGGKYAVIGDIETLQFRYGDLIDAVICKLRDPTHQDRVERRSFLLDEMLDLGEMEVKIGISIHSKFFKVLFLL